MSDWLSSGSDYMSLHVPISYTCGQIGVERAQCPQIVHQKHHGRPIRFRRVRHVLRQVLVEHVLRRHALGTVELRVRRALEFGGHPTPSERVQVL